MWWVEKKGNEAQLLGGDAPPHLMTLAYRRGKKFYLEFPIDDEDERAARSILRKVLKGSDFDVRPVSDADEEDTDKW